MTVSASVSERIKQQVLFVEQGGKRELLAQILKGKDVGRVLVFTRTKRRANRVMKQLTSQGIAADAIHADKNQGARQRALAAFDRGRVKVLVATDIVARGIDVEGISHVINYDLPNDKESYVHRIGRTARAGNEGIALSFCSAEEVTILRSIERLTGLPLAVVEDHAFHSRGAEAEYQKDSGSNNKQGVAKERREGGKPANSAQRRRSAGANGRANGNGNGTTGSNGNSISRNDDNVHVDDNIGNRRGGTQGTSTLGPRAKNQHDNNGSTLGPAANGRRGGKGNTQNRKPIQGNTGQGGNGNSKREFGRRTRSAPTAR